MHSKDLVHSMQSNETSDDHPGICNSEKVSVLWKHAEKNSLKTFEWFDFFWQNPVHQTAGNAFTHHKLRSAFRIQDLKFKPFHWKRTGGRVNRRASALRHTDLSEWGTCWNVTYKRSMAKNSLKFRAWAIRPHALHIKLDSSFVASWNSVLFECRTPKTN